MKIYRFNKILVAATLLLFVGQVTPSSKYTISQEEFDRLSKELSGSGNYTPFTRQSDDSMYGWTENEGLKPQDAPSDEELRKEAREEREKLRQQRRRSQGLGFGKVVPIDAYVNDATYLRSMFDNEQRSKSGESRTPLVVVEEAN